MRNYQIRDAPGDGDGDCFFHAIYKVLASKRPRTLAKLCIACRAIGAKAKKNTQNTQNTQNSQNICNETAFIVAIRAALSKMIKDHGDCTHGARSKSIVSAMYAQMMVLSVDEDVYQVVRENYPSWFMAAFPKASVLRATTEAKFRKVLARGVKQRHNYVQELELRLVQLLFRRIRIGKIQVLSGNIDRGENIVFAKRTLYLYNRNNVHYLGVYRA